MKPACALFLIVLASPHFAIAAPTAPCDSVVDVKSKSRQSFEGKILMTNLLTLEAEGEAKFHPAFAAPAQQCLFQTFEVAGSMIEAILSPFEAGENTLHWRFAAGGAEPRAVFVIYDGMASLIAKKTMFFVVEERGGKIDYYAMFRDQPTFAALKPLVSGIFDGSAKPLASVRWPPGAKEPEIEAYDGGRLK
jgi:hypothetical protein